MKIEDEACAQLLTDRIVALGRIYPEIAWLESPWHLFKFPKFECYDLQPSLDQAVGALAAAQAILRANLNL